MKITALKNRLIKLAIKGTTLVEILLYFAILGIVLFSAFTFTIQIYNINSLSTNFQELQYNLDFISRKIIDTVQTAESVDSGDSIFNNDEGALSLNMLSGVSPIKFYLDSGNVLIKQGNTSPLQLNSDYVKFNFLRFRKIEFSKAPDQIILDAWAENSKQSNLHITVSLRN